ncbi:MULTISPECIES: MoaD/ThiS family protein [Halobacterium]|uniref:MoaD/ThiS family protein n=1 Tax=Halobacterium TaxID=2239 RepID=UPI00073E962C|nr:MULTISPECIES: MoaD/ThiS family protein [Halobacterium]MCG1003543.1 MoaD/ThiS family protein [Halobacterium noricense]
MSVQHGGKAETATTTVEVGATGHVRRELGEHTFEFTFEGDTLGEFLDAFFEEYGLEEMLLAESEEEETAATWVNYPGDPPGRWERNPEGERTRAYARVLVNGRFNELLDGFSTELEAGDRVALTYPFSYCF